MNFKFHSVSISTYINGLMETETYFFKFHSVSISTCQFFGKYPDSDL